MRYHGRTGGSAPRSLPSWRRVTVRILLVPGLFLPVLLLQAVLTEALGLTSTHRVGSPDDPLPSAAARAGAAAPGETVHVVAVVVVLAAVLVGAVALFVRPERSGWAGHLLAVGVALLAVGLIVGNPDNYGGQAGVVDPLVIILPLPLIVAALTAGPGWRGGADAPTAGLLALAAISAGPAVWYGAAQALAQRNTFPPTADPHHNSHWYTTAVLAFLLVLLVAAAALASDGWRLPTLVAGTAAILLGITSLSAPEAASAVGLPWAVGAVLWGIALVGLVVQGGRPGRRGVGSRTPDQTQRPGGATPSPPPDDRWDRSRTSPG